MGMNTETRGAVSEGNQEMRQYCSFKIADRLYGFAIQDVKEITTEVPLTPIAHAPDTVKGYVNIRGQIHMVIDLKMLLGFDCQSYDEHCKVVLFKNEVGENFGVLVEDIGGVISVDEKKIEEKKTDNTSSEEKLERHFSSELVHGVYKLPEELLIILHADHLLESVQAT